jgi:membrane protein required for colicin V production
MVFDLIFLTVFVWAAYRGYTSGFIVQLATFAALVLGILGAVKFTGYLTEAFSGRTSISPENLRLIVFAATFIVIVIIVHLIGKLLEKLVEAIALGFVNRLLGALFNIAKFALIISALLVVLNKIDAHTSFLPKPLTQQSKFYKPLSNFAPAIFPYLRFENTKELLEGINQQIPA